MQYVSTLFDLSANLNTSIPVHVWQRAARGLFTILDRLDANTHIVLDETLEVTPERSEEPPPEESVRIAGNLRAFVERLDDEFFKILQVRQPSPEFRGVVHRACFSGVTRVVPVLRTCAAWPGLTVPCGW